MNRFLMWLGRRHPFAALVLSGGFRSQDAAGHYQRWIAENRER